MVHPDQVDRAEHDLKPGVVLVEGPAGQVAQPGRLGLPDPVLDPGVLAVPQFQPGGLPGHHPGASAGQQCGDPMSVDVGNGELGAGVGRSLRRISREPSGQPFIGQVDHAGGLGHPGTLTELPSVCNAGCQHSAGIASTIC